MIQTGDVEEQTSNITEWSSMYDVMEFLKQN